MIETPPKDRLAIQTVVAPFSESLVRRAIEEELARQGQVFLVHNRVETIYSLADLVSKLVPKARVVVGHGQMNEKELESVMLKFVRDEADVLVSTTIVENGLDIPRANTILINRADRFGLSELYQLRGRVGRSNQRAYAYLLVPEDVSLTPLATRRLAALKEFSALGAGFRVAALDLELRGAGNLLGGQQHGHINAIGFDLYCQMMERAVAALKGEEAKPEMRATINLGLDIRIPQEYIPNENLRLRTYKRIAGIANEAEREEVNQRTRGPVWAAASRRGQSSRLRPAERAGRGASGFFDRAAGQRSGHQISPGDASVTGKTGWADPVKGGRLAAGPQRHALDAHRAARPDRRKRQKRVASSGNEAINCQVRVNPMKPSKWLIFPLLFAGVTLYAQTKSVVVEEIVARVNNDIITREDLAHAREQAWKAKSRTNARTALRNKCKSEVGGQGQRTCFAI